MLHDDQVTGTWSLRRAILADAQWMADLKAMAMRPDLERLDYWDLDWVRQRFLDTYVPENTSVVVLDGLGRLRAASLSGPSPTSCGSSTSTSIPTPTFLNAVTIQYAKELADTNILINSACPGYVATDLNNFSGTSTPEQGAAVAIRLATLPDDGPTGQQFDADGTVPW